MGGLMKAAAMKSNKQNESCAVANKIIRKRRSTKEYLEIGSNGAGPLKKTSLHPTSPVLKWKRNEKGIVIQRQLDVTRLNDGKWVKHQKTRQKVERGFLAGLRSKLNKLIPKRMLWKNTTFQRFTNNIRQYEQKSGEWNSRRKHQELRIIEEDMTVWLKNPKHAEDSLTITTETYELRKLVTEQLGEIRNERKAIEAVDKTLKTSQSEGLKEKLDEMVSVLAEDRDLFSEISKNDQLPDREKRTIYLEMREFLTKYHGSILKINRELLSKIENEIDISSTLEQQKAVIEGISSVVTYKTKEIGISIDKLATIGHNILLIASQTKKDKVEVARAEVSLIAGAIDRTLNELKEMYKVQIGYRIQVNK